MYRINRKNGAGKSTLVDILSNKIITDDGVILDKDKLLQSENRSIMFQNDVFRSIEGN